MAERSPCAWARARRVDSRRASATWGCYERSHRRYKLPRQGPTAEEGRAPDSAVGDAVVVHRPTIKPPAAGKPKARSWRLAGGCRG
jgi:hypothetical protein